MKPLALNLCCGIYDDGWANGLVATGWDVINVGIEIKANIPTICLEADVREVAKDVEAYFPALKFDLVVASPPCQEFSYRSFPFKRCRELAKNVPPDKTIWEACEKIAKDLKVPLILENVRGARPYMGKSKWHYGAFHFWGEMPTLIPIGSPKKGFGRIDSNYEKETGKNGFRGDNPKMWKDREYNALRPKGFAGEYERKGGLKKKWPGEEEMKIDGEHPRSNCRKEWSAKIAMIPQELSEWIGKIYYPHDLKVL